MSDIELKNGFLCGLLSTGLGIGGNSEDAGNGTTTNTKLPPLEQLKIVNLDAYDCVATYLNATTYTPVLSSSFSYMPSQGYVIIGGYDLYDFEGPYWEASPEANVRIIVDGKTVFEDDSRLLFESVSFSPAMVFQYQTSFEFAAKRLNLSDTMQMLLRDTMVVGLK